MNRVHDLAASYLRDFDQALENIAIRVEVIGVGCPLEVDVFAGAIEIFKITGGKFETVKIVQVSLASP